jgi:hypothetical protein
MHTAKCYLIVKTLKFECLLDLYALIIALTIDLPETCESGLVGAHDAHIIPYSGHIESAIIAYFSNRLVAGTEKRHLQ